MENNLAFTPVSDKASIYYEACKNIYEKSFNEDERRDYEKTIALQNDNPFIFNAVVDKEKNAAVGLCSYWKLPNFYFIEHIAIDEYARGGKYGTKIVEKIKNLTDGQIIFEVEPPELSEIDRKRVEWYKRLGFLVNKYDYVQPAYGEGKKPLHLKLMSRFEIRDDNYEDVKNDIYKKIYFC